MGREYTVYKHVTPNGKVYVGITCCPVAIRWKRGKGYDTDQPLFHRAVLKYGWDNIAHEIIAEGLAEGEAKDMETRMITECRSNERAHGYNLTRGGDGCTGYKHSEETRAKMRANHADVSGSKNPFYGQDVRGDKNPSFGRAMPEHVKESLRSANKGRARTDKELALLRERATGDRNYFHGLRGGKSLVARKVIQYTKDGAEVARWDCIMDAERALGIKSQAITNVCSGRKKTAGGFIWKRIE